PLMGYPGIQLTHSTIKQNEFNWGLQFWTISELAKKYKPDGVFFMLDMVAILEPTAIMLSPDSFWKFSRQFISKLIDNQGKKWQWK
ncbi:MAG: hypothetical protein GWP06_08790, partial [Actinobacteria bacterium]|nr:hypothetical protein [Actinomycetota bacterium]